MQQNQPSIHSSEDERQSTGFTSFSNEFETRVNEETKQPGFTSDSDSNLLEPTETLPGYASESVLLRGLQIPTRTKSLTSGFDYPTVLERAGVTKEAWKDFTAEIVKHSSLNASQWTETIGTSAGAAFVGGLMVGFLGIIPAVIVGAKLRHKREKQNFTAASDCGALADCVGRWNGGYFAQRGLLIRIDIPGEASDMASMDVATAQSYKGRSREENAAAGSVASGSRYSDALVEESRARAKAARRGRIVILPLHAGSDIEKAMLPEYGAVARDDPPRYESPRDEPPRAEKKSERKSVQAKGLSNFNL